MKNSYKSPRKIKRLNRHTYLIRRIAYEEIGNMKKTIIITVKYHFLPTKLCVAGLLGHCWKRRKGVQSPRKRPGVLRGCGEGLPAPRPGDSPLLPGGSLKTEATQGPSQAPAFTPNFRTGLSSRRLERDPGPPCPCPTSHLPFSPTCKIPNNYELASSWTVEEDASKRPDTKTLMRHLYPIGYA